MADSTEGDVDALAGLRKAFEALLPDQFLAARVILWRIERERGEPDLAFELVRAKDARIADLEQRLADRDRALVAAGAALEMSSKEVRRVTDTLAAANRALEEARRGAERR